MKNTLDIFLKQYNMNGHEFSKRVGISEKTLSKISKRDPETYGVKTLTAIASVANLSHEEVLDNLLKIRDSDLLYVATTLKEICQKVKEKEEQFIIRGKFHDLLKEINQSKLSNSVEISFQLGAGGLGDAAVWIVNRIINSFSEDKNVENLKQDIATLYDIEILNQFEAKLRLKQLNY